MAAPDFKTSASLTPKVLCSAQIASTSETALYTVPASTGVKIAHGTVSNTSGSAVTVGLSVVPAVAAGPGGTTVAGDGTHKIIPDTYSLAAGDTLSLRDFLAGAMLGPGDAVYIHVGTANVIDVTLTGAVSA